MEIDQQEIEFVQIQSKRDQKQQKILNLIKKYQNCLNLIEKTLKTTQNWNWQYDFDFKIWIGIKSLSEFGWLGIQIINDSICRP